MKPHIAQTVADLKAEAAYLAQMIATLERYGIESDPTAPVPQVTPTPQGASPTPAALEQPRSLRRVSISKPRGPYKPRKPKPDPAAPATASEPPKEPEGVTELVRAAVGRVTQPFSRVDVIHRLTTHYPEKMEDIKPVAVDGVLCRFRKSGELLEAGERPGLTGPLTLHKRP